MKNRLYEATSSQKEKYIKHLCDITGEDPDVCEEALEESDWDLDKARAYFKTKKKKNKEKKIFNIGDIVICIDSKPGKLPPDCVDFLITYKKFKVLDVNDKFNIDLGHRSAESNNPYYFSPNRFELKDGKAPVRIIGAEETENTPERTTERKDLPEPKNLRDPWQSVEDLKKKMDTDSYYPPKNRPWDDWGARNDDYHK